MSGRKSESHKKRNKSRQINISLNRSNNNAKAVVGGGKNKARDRDRPGKPATGMIAVLAGLLTSVLEESPFVMELDGVNFVDMNNSERIKLVKGMFNRGVENVTQNSPYIILNVGGYKPLGIGMATGHTLIAIQDRAGFYGTIGFYPKNYYVPGSVFSSVFKTVKGVLASPDPIGRSSFEKMGYGPPKLTSIEHGSLSDTQAGKLNEWLTKGSPPQLYTGGVHETTRKADWLRRGHTVHGPPISTYLRTTRGSYPEKNHEGVNIYETDIKYSAIPLENDNNCLTFLNNEMKFNINIAGTLGIPNLVEKDQTYDPDSTADPATAPALPDGTSLHTNMARMITGGGKKSKRSKISKKCKSKSLKRLIDDIVNSTKSPKKKRKISKSSKKGSKSYKKKKTTKSCNCKKTKNSKKPCKCKGTCKCKKKNTKKLRR